MSVLLEVLIFWEKLTVRQILNWFPRNCQLTKDEPQEFDVFNFANLIFVISMFRPQLYEALPGKAASFVVVSIGTSGLLS